MPSGAGKSPAGVSPYGYGTPTTAPSVGGKALAGDQGKQYSGRKIDPVTRQYVYGADGRAAGESKVHQRVKLVALTELGSSAVDGLGHDMNSVKEISANFQERVNATYERAYQRMVDEGLIEFISARAEVSTSANGFNRAVIVVKFKDLTTGEEEEVSV